MSKKNAVITCGCHQCMGFGRRSAWAKETIQNTIQKLRHRTKHFLKKGDYDKAMDVIVSTGYLD